MSYGVGENVPFSVLLFKNNGQPQGGEIPHLTIFNDSLGTKILNAVNMTETLPGYYTYLWTNAVAANTSLTYYVENANSILASGKFRVVNSPDSIKADISQARADLLADILAKKDEILAQMASDDTANDTRVSTARSDIINEIINSLTIISENIDDSDGRVS